MQARIFRTTLAGIVALLALATAPTVRAQAPDSLTAGQRALATLHAEDQGDRRLDPAQFARLSPAEQDSLDRWLQGRDSTRRTRVRELVAQGAARTAQDFYRAAVVLQHGRSDADNLQAHEWAKSALAIDSTHQQARYLFAASWDRHLAGQGKSQWYGTVVSRRADGRAELHPVDSTRVTDADRQRHTGWTLAERRASVERRNAGASGQPRTPD